VASPNRLVANPAPHGLFSIPRALVQVLQIEKGEVMEWVLEGGELVLKRLGSQRMQAEAWTESLQDISGVLVYHWLCAEEAAGHPRHTRH
jgi:bifunctional DNA-binding transcriptional regulator/antitoxin component of YhaV-PrlF toxin-antitoxin module